MPRKPKPHLNPVRSNSNSPARFQNSNWLLGILLFVAVVLAYQPAWHAGFIWDDNMYVTNNPLLTVPDGLRRIWFSTDAPSQYFPLTYTILRLEHALWGLNSTGYHLFNIFLHAANALLVWRLLKRLTIPGAWLAAAIFALHPVQVESVAWIAECKNVLMCFFFLLTLLCWIEFIKQSKWRFYFLALLLYALSLCSKTTACTLPAALLLILWLKEMPIGWRRIVQVVPFLAMGIGMGLLTVWWERFHIGTHGTGFSLTIVERILIASHAIWFYAGKLFWPVNLTFSYPKWTLHPDNPTAYGWLMASVALGVIIYFARRFAGRSVEVAVLFFVSTLAPISGFIMLYTFRYTFVADHYQYVACIGLITLMSVAIVTSLQTRPILKQIVCGILLLALGILTWRQCRMYSNSETLWQTTIERNPESFIAHNNLGYYLEQKGNIADAIANYKKGIEIEPNNWEAYLNLGNALSKRDQLDNAIADYKKSIAINPGYLESYSDLANIYLKKGQIDEAITNFQAVLKIEPSHVDANDGLGLAFFQKGDFTNAIVHYQKALKYKPDDVSAHINLGQALFKIGQSSNGLTQWQCALEINPQSMAARNDLAWVLATFPDASLRDGNKAVELAEKANQLAGENAITLGTLGAAYAETGQFSNAIVTAQRALQLAETQRNEPLANVLRKQIALYQNNVPVRDYNLTNASRPPGK